MEKNNTDTWLLNYYLDELIEDDFYSVTGIMAQNLQYTQEKKVAMFYRSRIYWPKYRKRHDYSNASLFTMAETAKLAYHQDLNFRKFVNEWDKENVDLFGWTLEDFYRQYKLGPQQLKIAFTY